MTLSQPVPTYVSDTSVCVYLRLTCVRRTEETVESLGAGVTGDRGTDLRAARAPNC